jgi:hypothetical protein
VNAGGVDQHVEAAMPFLHRREGCVHRSGVRDVDLDAFHIRRWARAIGDDDAQTVRRKLTHDGGTNTAEAANHNRNLLLAHDIHAFTWSRNTMVSVSTSSWSVSM